MGYLKFIFTLVAVCGFFATGGFYFLSENSNASPVAQKDISNLSKSNPCVDELNNVKEKLRNDALSLSDKKAVSNYINQILILGDNIVTINKNSNSVTCQADFRLDYIFLDDLKNDDLKKIKKMAEWSMMNKDFTVTHTQSEGRFIYKIQKSFDAAGGEKTYINVEKGGNLSLAMLVTSNTYNSFVNGKL